jgi:hypothetical protein
VRVLIFMCAASERMARAYPELRDMRTYPAELAV